MARWSVSAGAAFCALPAWRAPPGTCGMRGMSASSATAARASISRRAAAVGAVDEHAVVLGVELLLEQAFLGDPGERVAGERPRRAAARLLAFRPQRRAEEQVAAGGHGVGDRR